MHSKVRNGLIVGAGLTAGAAALNWLALRHAAGMMLTEIAPLPEPPPELPPGEGGQVIQWPQPSGTNVVVGLDKTWEDFEHAVLAGVDAAADVTDVTWQIYGGTVKQSLSVGFDIFKGAYDVFGEVFGEAEAFFEDVTSRAINVVLATIGAATADSVRDLAAATRGMFRRVQNQIDTLRSTVNDLISKVGDVDRLAHLAYEAATYILPQALFDGERVLGDAITAGDAALWDAINQLSNIVNAGLQDANDRIDQSYTTITEWVTNEIYAPLIDVADSPLLLAGLAELGALAIRVDGLAQTVAENAQASEECCAADTNWRKQQQPNLDKLKELLDFLALGFGLYSARELIDMVSGFLDDHATDAGNMVADWLDGTADVTDFLGLEL